MKKFLLLLLIAITLVAVYPNKIFAAEGECHLKHCLVPAPTVFGPEQNAEVSSQRPVIYGLTWKTTKVKVFLDGQELTDVAQIKHLDYYGSFAVRPNYNLTPGEHYVYTIAYSENPGPYDQSKESVYIRFKVKLPYVAPVATKPAEPQPVAQNNEPEAVPQDSAPTEINIAPAENQNTDQDVPVQISDITSTSSVSVDEGRIEGGVYVTEDEATAPANLPSTDDKTAKADDLNLQGAAGLSDLGDFLNNEFANQEQQNRAAKNRLVGLVLLALIAAAAIIWLISDKRRIYKESDRHNDGELPPPPEPPKDRVILNNRQNKILTNNTEDVPKGAADHYFANPVADGAYAPLPDEFDYVTFDQNGLTNKNQTNRTNGASSGNDTHLV